MMNITSENVRRTRSLSPEKNSPTRNHLALQSGWISDNAHSGPANQSGWISDSSPRNISRDNVHPDDFKYTIISFNNQQGDSKSVWSDQFQQWFKRPKLGELWGLSLMPTLSGNMGLGNWIHILQNPGAEKLQQLLTYYLNPNFVVLPEDERTFKDNMNDAHKICNPDTDASLNPFHAVYYFKFYGGAYGIEEKLVTAEGLRRLAIKDGRGETVKRAMKTVRAEMEKIQDMKKLKMKVWFKTALELCAKQLVNELNEMEEFVSATTNPRRGTDVFLDPYRTHDHQCGLTNSQLPPDNCDGCKRWIESKKANDDKSGSNCGQLWQYQWR